MDTSEYDKHAHGMQAGVAMDMQNGSKDTEPKHLRVGINVALADHGALVTLLVEKGIFTSEEYLDAITYAMQKERESYEKRLSTELGIDVKLY